VVPIETQCYSMKAIDDLTNTFNLLKEKMGHKLKTWILPTKIDRRLKLSNRMLDMLGQTFQGRLLSPIKTDANIAKAPLIKSPMVFCFPQSRSAKDYTNLALELINSPEIEEGEPQEESPPFDEGEGSEGSGAFEFKEISTTMETGLGELPSTGPTSKAEKSKRAPSRKQKSNS